jgi:hypothetical protein
MNKPGFEGALKVKYDESNLIIENRITDGLAMVF